MIDDNLVSIINEIKIKLLLNKGFERVDCRFDDSRGDLNVLVSKHIYNHTGSSGLFSLEQIITYEMTTNVPVDVIVDTVVNEYECRRKEKTYESLL